MEQKSIGRILYHHRTQGMGVEGVHIRGMVDAFKRAGYQVDIIGPPGVDPYSLKSTEKKVENRSFFSSLYRIISEIAPEAFFELSELFYNFYAYTKLKKALKHKSYDFVYERYALNTFVLASLATKHNLPYVLEVNDATIIERSRPLFFQKLAQRIERRIFDKSSIIVTITNHFKELIIRNYKIGSEKILVLPNAIDPERFRLNPAYRIDKKRLGISGKYVIGCVGTFVPWHGLDFLIHSVYRVIKKLDIHLLFVGDGPVRSHIERLAIEYGISDKIRFTGFQPTEIIPYYIDVLDICVIPGSNAHGSPMKLFEFMAMGKPIILPKYRPLQEIVEHGVEGLFFDPGNSQQLCKLIEKLIFDVKLRQRLGLAAKEKVMRIHTWDRNVQELFFKLNLKSAITVQV